jgi:hypothetical protein
MNQQIQVSHSPLSPANCDTPVGQDIPGTVLLFNKAAKGIVSVIVDGVKKVVTFSGYHARVPDKVFVEIKKTQTFRQGNIYRVPRMVPVAGVKIVGMLDSGSVSHVKAAEAIMADIIFDANEKQVEVDPKVIEVLSDSNVMVDDVRRQITNNNAITLAQEIPLE